MKLTLPLPPNLANQRKHWRAKNRQKREYWNHLNVFRLKRGFPKPTKAPERAQAESTRRGGDRADRRGGGAAIAMRPLRKHATCLLILAGCTQSGIPTAPHVGLTPGAYAVRVTEIDLGDRRIDPARAWSLPIRIDRAGPLGASIRGEGWSSDAPWLGRSWLATWRSDADAIEVNLLPTPHPWPPACLAVVLSEGQVRPAICRTERSP